jgi:hypothetical protein
VEALVDKHHVDLLLCWLGGAHKLLYLEFRVSLVNLVLSLESI